MTVPAVGSLAPEFELRDQHGRMHRLSDYRGRKNALVVFFPFAFTGVCTGELSAIRADLAALESHDAQVLAVSCDPMSALRAFAEQEGYDYPLLSDFWPHGAVATAYGVFNPAAGAAGRGTFVVDKGGAVRWTVQTAWGEARDVAAYRKALADL